MQAVTKLVQQPSTRRSRMIRIARVVLLRFLHKALRTPSTIVDRMAPDVEDRSGFGPLSFR